MSFSLETLLHPRAIALMSAAVSVALLHTAVGVDHYLPFVVLGRARRWPLRKVAIITAFCGVGHVVGSILLGGVGIALGSAIGQLEVVESIRGELAAWGLIAFGLGYIVWALRRNHSHQHDFSTASLTVRSLFILFVLGPCEPLIPVLMAPAYNQNWLLVGTVAVLFSVTTIGAMVALAVMGSLGMRFLPLKALEHHGHVAAGVAIAGSGLAIKLLGI